MTSATLESTAFMFSFILASVGITLVSGWLGIVIARKMRLLDIPGAARHKQHQKPMPYAGGIALILTLLVLLAFLKPQENPQVLFTVLAGLVIFAFGVWDDARGLGAPLKLTGQVIASLILMFSGVYIRVFESLQFPFADNQTLNQWLDWGLTLFWLIGITNAFNLVDSMDGLAVGLSGWAFGFFMLATFGSGQFGLSAFSAVLLGCCISLYFYNLSPASLFLGDSGAQTLGFFLAAIGIMYSPMSAAGEQASSWFVPILLVGVPIFDTTLVTISRLRRGLPFYLGRRDHTYHRLVHWGMPPARAVMTMHISALLLECTAFVAFSFSPLWANLLFGAILLLGGLLITVLDNRKRWKTEDGV